MKLNLKIITSLLVLTLFACKKNKYEPDILDGDLSYLVGIWQWDSTNHRHNWCTGGATIEEMIYKETDEFKLIFEESGYVSYLANDSLIFRKGVTINFFIDQGESSKHVAIYLDGDPNDIFAFYGDFESTIATVYPYEENDGGCEDYINYFSKE